jgi:aromatic-L-amino-acid decarboxylase
LEEPYLTTRIGDAEVEALGDWSPEQFELYGRQLLDGIRSHFESIRDVPVTTEISPQDLIALFDAPLPTTPIPFAETLRATWGDVVPNLTHWNHPAFHAYFSTSASFPGMLADLLISAMNVNAMVWKSGPAASALEKVVLGWLAELVGYPQDADGVLVNGASLATFYALVAARDAMPGLEVRTRGVSGNGVPTLRLYTSDQAHSSVEKAAIALGVGTDNVVLVPSDANYAMDVQALAQHITDDLQAGFAPMAVVATVGTTSTGAIDPLAQIADICKRHGIWLHVDGAYGGFWRVAPELRNRMPDMSVGDSLVVNPHKCLYTPLEVTTLFCRRRGALANSFRLVPEYLTTGHEDGSVDYMDFSLQLGRSFRALKLWWIIRTFGRTGLESRMSESLRLTRWLEEQVRAHPDFECVASSPFGLICIRHVPPAMAARPDDADAQNLEQRRRALNEHNQQLLVRINQTRTAFLSHTVIRGDYVLRISIGNIRTTQDDINRLWTTVQTLAV